MLIELMENLANNYILFAGKNGKGYFTFRR